MTLLERWRTDAGLSRAELAGAAKVSREAIRKIEVGKAKPRPATAAAIGSILGHTASEVTEAAQRGGAA